MLDEMEQIEKMFVDPGPDLEFEAMVGTKEIVAKYRELVYKEQPPDSDSSDEPYQFNVGKDKQDRIDESRLEEQRLVAARKKLTSGERIQTYKQRYRGAGAIFRAGTNRGSKALSKLTTKSINETESNRDD